MKKKGLTHLIATDKPKEYMGTHIGILKGIDKGMLDYDKLTLQSENLGYVAHMWEAQHLYITTDEEIKEGDWCIDVDSVGRNTLTQAKEWKLLESLKYIGARKVVATDNHKLWYIDLPELHGIPAGKGVNIPKIPTPFLKEYVEKQPKEVMLELQAYNNNTGKPIEDDGYVDNYSNGTLKLNSSGEVIISSVDETWNTIWSDICKYRDEHKPVYVGQIWEYLERNYHAPKRKE